MKGFLSTLCLLALLFTMSGCEGALGKLMDAMRTGWEKVQNIGKNDISIDDIAAAGDATKEEVEAAKRLEAVPGPPLSAQEKIQVVRATNLGQFSKEHPREKDEFGIKLIGLNKQYANPQKKSYAPKDLNQVCTLSAQIKSFKLVDSNTVAQQISMPEYRVPDLPLWNDSAYKELRAQYKNAKGETVYLIVHDWNGEPEWAKTAIWYYERKGYIPSSEKSMGYTFAGTKDHLNHTWVVWSKQGRYRFESYWDGTYLISLDGVSNKEDIALIDGMLNQSWLQKAK